MGPDSNLNNDFSTFDELLSAAGDYSVHLADRLLGARQALLDESNRVRVQQASSSLRSIMELLPVSLRAKVAQTSADREIAASEFLRRLINTLQDDQSLHAGSALIQAKRIADEAAPLFKDAQRGTKQKAKDTLIALDPLFSSLPTPIQDRMIEEWTSAWTWFSGVIHNKEQLPEVGELIKHETAIHRVLEILLGKSVVRNIEQIRLLVARESSENASELFAQISRFLTYGACYEYFFRQINSEKWVRVLIDEGFFTSPSVQNQNSQTLEQQHLVQPLNYLLRIADINPELTGMALRQVQSISSPYVKSLVVDILAKCTGKEINDSVHMLIRWRVFETRLVSAASLLTLVQRLIDLGFNDSALNLASSVLEIADTETNGRFQNLNISSWEYSEFCRGLVPILGEMPLLQILTDLFRDLEVLESKTQILSSAYWFPRFGPRLEDKSAHSPKEVVAHTIAELTESIIAASPENLADVLEALKGGESDFLQRASFYARTLAAPKYLDDSWETLFDFKLLEKPPNIREPWLLAAALIPHVTDEQTSHLLSFLIDENRKFHPESPSGAPLEIFHVLGISGSPLVQSKLDQLDAIYKRDLSARDEHPRIAGFGNPIQGEWFSKDWIASVGAHEFIDTLSTRIPLQLRVSSLMQGIANNFAEVLSDNPKYSFDGIRKLVDYPQIVAVLCNSRGLDLVEMTEAEIVALLSLVISSINSFFSSATDKDLNYFPYNDLNRFVRAVFLHRVEGASAELNQLAWSSLLVILQTALYYPSMISSVHQSRDYFTRALNNGYSAALELGFTCIIISRQFSSQDSALNDAKKQVHRAIVSPTQGALSSSMLGAYFTQLLEVDSVWAMKLANSHNLKNSSWEIFVSFFATYLTWGSPTESSFQKLIPLYKRAFRQQSKIERVPIRDELLQGTIRQLAIFYIQGRIDLEEVFEHNWEKGQDGALGAKAIEQLGAILSREDELPTEYATAAISLWDSYYQSISSGDAKTLDYSKAFSTWFTADCLPVAWRIQVLTSLVTNGISFTSDLHGMLETLNSSFDKFPVEVLTTATMLISDPSSRKYLSWSISHVYAIIEKARRDKNPDTAKLLSDLLETLAKLGFHPEL